jgi:putative tricarboxylic transport membrane protein
MKIYQIIGGLFWLIVGFFFCVGGIRLGFGAWHAPGAGFFPMVVSIILIILSFLTFSNSLSLQFEAYSFWKHSGSWKTVGFVVACLLFYICALEFLGYLLTTFIFLSVLLRFVGKRGMLKTLIISGTACAASYYGFKVLLMVPLPTGILVTFL